MDAVFVILREFEFVLLFELMLDRLEILHVQGAIRFYGVKRIEQLLGRGLRSQIRWPLS